jgi:hypothetical protein
MPVQNQNFEPVYAALASLLISACTTTFVATATGGSPILTGVPPDLPLVRGLALFNAGCIPVGAKITDVGSGTLTMDMPASADATDASFRAGFVSESPLQARLLRHWSDMQAAEQPVLFITQTGETAERRVGQLTKWTLDVLVYVYIQSQSDRYPVAPSMNALLGAVRGAMQPDSSGPGRASFRNTLGGLVFDCEISGKIETDEGVLGQQGVAKIPIRIIQNGP